MAPPISVFTAANKQIFTCTSGISTSTAPRWSASLSSEYTQPLTDELDGFLRGLLYYYPRNPFAAPGYVVQAYATLDLYLGVRSSDNSWEVTAYGKKIGNAQTITSINQSPTI